MPLADPDLTSVSVETTWLDEFKEDAARRFQQLDWPKRTDEKWRFANLKHAPFDDFAPAAEAPSIQVPPGVQVVPLEQLPFERVRPYLPALRGRLGAEKYLALAHSGPISAICVLVPANLEATSPVIIQHTAAHSVATMTLILTEANSSVTVFERLLAGEEPAASVIGNTLVAAGQGSKVTYVLSQELADRARHVHASHVAPGRDAHIRFFTGNFGGLWIRQEVVAELGAPGSDCEILGLNLIHGEQEIDQRTYQHHSSGKAHSNLLYKNALFDQSRGIFSGLIRVDEGAHQTDAFQSCRNLLLSDDAEVNALPGLEINADQVRCSHGATTGQIDPEELFYLRARGIPDDRARRLITLGFAQNVIEKVKDDGIQARLSQLVEARLG